MKGLPLLTILTLVPLLELKAARCGVKLVPQNQRQRQRPEAESQREPAREPLLLRVQANHHQSADERRHCQDGEKGKPVHEARHPQMRNSTSTVSATPIRRR